MNLDKLLKLAHSFESLAKKRKEKSIKKQYKTMAKGKKHPFTSIFKKLEKHKDKIDDPAALAAYLKDIGIASKKWRKGKKK